MRFRPQRGSLEESMAEVVDVPPSYAHLARILDVDPARVEVRVYVRDSRIHWDTHVVLVDGQAVGFTDQPPCPKA